MGKWKVKTLTDRLHPGHNLKGHMNTWFQKASKLGFTYAGHFNYPRYFVELKLMKGTPLNLNQRRKEIGTWHIGANEAAGTNFVDTFTQQKL